MEKNFFADFYYTMLMNLWENIHFDIKYKMNCYDLFKG